MRYWVEWRRLASYALRSHSSRSFSDTRLLAHRRGAAHEREKVEIPMSWDYACSRTVLLIFHSISLPHFLILLLSLSNSFHRSVFICFVFFPFFFLTSLPSIFLWINCIHRRLHTGSLRKNFVLHVTRFAIPCLLTFFCFPCFLLPPTRTLYSSLLVRFHFFFPFNYIHTSITCHILSCMSACIRRVGGRGLVICENGRVCQPWAI